MRTEKAFREKQGENTADQLASMNHLEDSIQHSSANVLWFQRTVEDSPHAELEGSVRWKPLDVLWGHAQAADPDPANHRILVGLIDLREL
jgi:hypothetical protein